MRMKILIATGIYPPDIGGPATYSELIFNELPKKGIAVDVLSFGSVRHQPKIVRHINYFLKTLWHARSSDIIFAQDTVSVGLPSLLAATLLGKIFIVRVPGDYAWEQSTQRYGVTDGIDEFQKKAYGSRVERLRRIQRFVLNHADRIIAPSRYFADIVRGWVKQPDKVSHIYNGVDVDALKRYAVGGRAPRTLVTAGRLVPWKGFPMLITAMKDLPDWKLEIAGDGPEMGHLRALIAKEGLGDRVSLLGRLDKDALRRKIAASAAFALNTSYETFAFQIVEAMALGAAVITTNVSNLREIIDDGVDGYLIKPDDQPAFVAAVRKIAVDPAARERLGGAAMQKAQGFSIEKTLSQVVGAFSHLMNNETPMKKMKVRMAKIVRYIFSGGLAALTDLVALYVFKDVIGIWYLTSAVLAFLIAFVVSFSLQKFFTFQDHSMEGLHGQAATYFVVSGLNLLLNTFFMYVLVDRFGMHYMFAQILTSLVLAMESFVVYGMFIFKKRPRDASQQI